MCSNEMIPPPFREGALKTAAALAEIVDVLIAAHVALDGDALGSMAASGWLLQERGRRCALYAPKGVPEKLAFLPLPGPVFTALADLPFEPKSALYLDCSEPARLGAELAKKYADWPSINIDHHLGSEGMGSLCNYVCPAAAATAQLVAYAAMAGGEGLAGPAGEALGLGLMTDTGGFCHGNTTADVFALCARLAREGCDFSRMREAMQHSWSLEKLRLWGYLFQNTNLEIDDSVAICVVTLADLAKFNCRPDDAEGLAEWLRRLQKARITAIMREDAPCECKFSLRSYGSDDVREIAGSLGGGGHRNAAGGMIFASPKKAAQILLDAIAAHLRGEHS